jgi:hypothetical protein
MEIRSMNREPTMLLLRLRDVLAWIPTLTRHELYRMEREGVITTFRRNAKSQRWYYTAQIAKLCCGTNGNEKVKEEGRK